MTLYDCKIFTDDRVPVMIVKNVNTMSWDLVFLPLGPGVAEGHRRSEGGPGRFLYVLPAVEGAAPGYL